MTHDIPKLMNGYLDGLLNVEQEAALNDWVKATPENAAEFANMVRFHDRLQHVICSESMTEMRTEPTSAHETAGGRPPRRYAWVGGFAAIAAALLVAFWLSNPPVASAASEFERLIDRATHAGDRVYRITSMDPNPRPIEPRQAPIDGAKLFVGPPDRYVLIRYFPDGREYATGFDGERNWAAPPEGAVRLSRDPLRFRWPLPGHQYGIPFADLRSDLVQLRDAYIVTPLGTDASGQRSLLAIKKSVEYRGPNRVELWYDPATGVIHRMVFAGLPRARGGPDSVAVELLERRELGNDFFKHNAHHAADQRVIEED